jgi:hypothetical protein
MDDFGHKKAFAGIGFLLATLVCYAGFSESLNGREERNKINAELHKKLPYEARMFDINTNGALDFGELERFSNHYEFKRKN